MPFCAAPDVPPLIGHESKVGLTVPDKLLVAVDEVIE
jgi:hypothetical protein